MIKYYNIPIFMPELACPYRCVYCNQFSITGLNDIIKPDDVKSIIDNYLSSFKEENRFVEVAFFGGNFTGLPLKMQNDYLDVVQPYLDKDLIHGIRCSTRPDYITYQRVKELRHLGMRNIELGAQSTNDVVLSHCKRGHSYNDIVEASQIILSEDITLGLQMMIGLPFSNKELDFQTAKDIVNLGAKETRIYPCIVVKDTELEAMYHSGEYKSISMEDAIAQSADLYSYFIENQVKVLRIGLHVSDELDGEAYVAGPYHKNFAEMVFSHIWKKKFEKLKNSESENLKNKDIVINVPASQINHAIGWNGENKKLLLERFRSVDFKCRDASMIHTKSTNIDTSYQDNGQFDFTITSKDELPTIIADSRMPEKAKKNLKKLGNVLFINPTSITYNSISAHPDIFFFQKDDALIYAPNAPKRIVKELKKRKINLIEGTKEVGKKYPETVPYNAVGVGNLLIHNLKHTDSKILTSYENHINVNQGYTRCNLLALNENAFITSDMGIFNAVKSQRSTVNSHCPQILYIDPKQIKLEGQKNGFFPGCCGVWKNNLIVCGSTKNLKEKEELDKFLKDNDFNLLELYNGDLIDVGSVFVIENL